MLFSTDVDLEALTIFCYDKACFQIEFLFRDAKQFTGLTDCQARSQAKLNFHFNASLSAVTLAKLEARQRSGEQRGSIFHGQSQTACLQSTSNRANLSAFSQGAQLGKIQS